MKEPGLAWVQDKTTIGRTFTWVRLLYLSNCNLPSSPQLSIDETGNHALCSKNHDTMAMLKPTWPTWPAVSWVFLQTGGRKGLSKLWAMALCPPTRDAIPLRPALLIIVLGYPHHNFLSAGGRKIERKPAPHPIIWCVYHHHKLKGWVRLPEDQCWHKRWKADSASGVRLNRIQLNRIELY